MGLHLSLYVLVDQRELTSGQATAPMTRLDINEHMGLNRLIKDVSVHGKCQEGVVPVMSPSPVLRDFKLRDIAHGGPEDKSFDEFGTDFYGNPLTWVYADELTGSLWYYARKPAFKIPFSDGETRARLYRFAFERDEPQYLIRDSATLGAEWSEIELLGGTLEPRGEVGGSPYYYIHWPESGPGRQPLAELR